MKYIVKHTIKNCNSNFVGDSPFPEDCLVVKLRRMRADGVTNMAVSPAAFDDDINAPYDFNSDIRGDKMAEAEYQRLRARGEFINNKTLNYQNRFSPDPTSDTSNSSQTSTE